MFASRFIFLFLSFDIWFFIFFSFCSKNNRLSVFFKVSLCFYYFFDDFNFKIALFKRTFYFVFVFVLCLATFENLYYTYIWYFILMVNKLQPNVIRDVNVLYFIVFKFINSTNSSRMSLIVIGFALFCFAFDFLIWCLY